MRTTAPTRPPIAPFEAAERPFELSAAGVVCTVVAATAGAPVVGEIVGEIVADLDWDGLGMILPVASRNLPALLEQHRPSLLQQ